MGNMLLALIMVGLLVVILMGFVRSIRPQQEGRIGLIEAWGKFERVVVPGRYMIWPWERLAGELPLQIFEFTTAPQKLVLKGGAPLTLSAIVYYQIENAHNTPGAPRPLHVIGQEPPPIGTPAGVRTVSPATVAAAPAVAARRNGNGIGVDSLEPVARSHAQRRANPTPVARTTAIVRRAFSRNANLIEVYHAAYRAFYLVADWREATEKEAVATLQQVFSKVSVADDIFGNVNWQEALGARVRDHLSAKTQQWGVQILDVAFKDVSFSEQTLQNMYAEPRATREGRIRAMEAENYQRIAELLHLTPAQLLSWRQVEVMRELAKSPQPRVMFTTDILGHAAAGLPQQGFAAGGDQSNQAPPPNVRGYLGGEPPPPPLPRDVAERGGPSGSAGGSEIVAPSLQNVDQQ